MSSLDLVVIEGGRQKRKVSSDQVIDFSSVRIGANNLPITEVDSNTFGFGTKKIGSIGNAAADTDAASWGQIKEYVGQQVVTAGTVKQQLLTQQQLSTTLGILPGTVFFLSANATADDVFSLKDADDNVESWTFVAARSGANEVTIGADAAESMSNLAAAILADSAYWKAYYDLNALASIYANGLIGIYSKTIKAFRCYITQTGGTLAGYVANYSGEIEYKSDPNIVIPIPTADPAVAYSGFSQAKANLENGELHNVLAEDKIYSWNGDANSGVGEWFTMTEGLMPVATADAGGGTLGKVTADTDSGLDITGIGILVVKVDTSTIDFTAGGSLEVVDAGITAAKLASDVAGAGITLNGTSNAIDVNVDDSTLEVATDVVQVKDAGITAAKLNSDVAGAGIVQDGVTGALDVNVDDSTLEIATDVVQVKDAGVTAAKLNADVFGAGVIANITTNAVDVNVDDSTIAIVSDALEVKDAGITAAKLASDVFGAGLVPNGTSNAADVNVDDSTLEIATDVVQVKDAGITAAKLNADVAGDGLALNGTSNALDIQVGDGIQIASDAVAADYSKSMTNDNAGAITIRQVVYVKSNGNVDLAQANVANLADAMLGLVAVASIATTEAGAITVRRGAVVGGFSGLTPGKVQYVSRGTAGALAESLTGFVAGEFVYSVGRAISATEIVFDPQFIVEW